MNKARVHVAGSPGRTLERASRIVQPCSRCGIVLSEFDEAHPPMTTGPGRSWAWWEGQVERDPGYPDGTPTMLSIANDDVGVPLCDPAESDAAGVEVFRAEVAA